MRYSLIGVLVVLCAVPLFAESEALSLEEFMRRALENNPEVASLRADSRQSRSLAERSGAVKDLLFSASAGYTETSPVYSAGE